VVERVHNEASPSSKESIPHTILLNVNRTKSLPAHCGAAAAKSPQERRGAMLQRLRAIARRNSLPEKIFTESLIPERLSKLSPEAEEKVDIGVRVKTCKGIVVTGGPSGLACQYASQTRVLRIDCNDAVLSPAQIQHDAALGKPKVSSGVYDVKASSTVNCVGYCLQILVQVLWAAESDTGMRRGNVEAPIG